MQHPKAEQILLDPQVIDHTTLSRRYSDLATSKTARHDKVNADKNPVHILVDSRGGFSIRRAKVKRFDIEAGDLIIADRGYARGSNFRHVVESGGDFIIRSGWKTQKLWMPESRSRFDVFKALGDIQEDEIADIHVVANRRDTGQPVDVRFIAMRKPQSAVYHSREQVRQRTRDTGKTPAPQSFIAADFMLVITSLSRDEYPPERVLALYRIRWQVELAFKRLKSLLHLGRLPAKDKALAGGITPPLHQS